KKPEAEPPTQRGARARGPLVPGRAVDHQDERGIGEKERGKKIVGRKSERTEDADTESDREAAETARISQKCGRAVEKGQGRAAQRPAPAAVLVSRETG